MPANLQPGAPGFLYLPGALLLLLSPPSTSLGLPLAPTVLANACVPFNQPLLLSPTLPIWVAVSLLRALDVAARLLYPLLIKFVNLPQLRLPVLVLLYLLVCPLHVCFLEKLPLSLRLKTSLCKLKISSEKILRGTELLLSLLLPCSTLSTRHLLILFGTARHESS
jgi:hypothetical protein